MVTHAHDCPAGTGELDICTCDTIFRFSLAQGDRMRPQDAPPRRATPDEVLGRGATRRLSRADVPF
jgi:hypothetical protein